MTPGYVPKFDPTAPYADANGMVAHANVDLASELIQQLMGALRLDRERAGAAHRRADDGDTARHRGLKERPAQAPSAVSTSFTQYDVPTGIASSLKLYLG